MENLDETLKEYRETIEAKTKATYTVDSLERKLTELTKELSDKNDEVKRLSAKMTSIEERIKYFNTAQTAVISKAIGGSRKRKLYGGGVAKTLRIPKLKDLLLDEDYDFNFTYRKKCEYILSKVKSCLTGRDIVEKIKELEPLNNESDRTMIASVLSTLSSSPSKGASFNRYKDNPEDEKEDWKYGLSEWFNHGVVKDEHRYRKSTRDIYDRYDLM